METTAATRITQDEAEAAVDVMRDIAEGNETVVRRALNRAEGAVMDGGSWPVEVAATYALMHQALTDAPRIHAV